jgi:hypothetical protein
MSRTYILSVFVCGGLGLIGLYWVVLRSLRHDLPDQLRHAPLFALWLGIIWFVLGVLMLLGSKSIPS